MEQDTTKQQKALPGGSVWLAIALTAAWLLLMALVPVFENYRLIHRDMMWNLFLALVPLAPALVLARRRARGKRGVLNGLLWLVWLLFLPNGPYMVTDLMHIDRYLPGGGQLPTLDGWMGILHITSAIVAAATAGSLSMYLVYPPEKSGRRVLRMLAAGGVSLLCGVGIYIGRYLRFNSWDALTRPLAVIEETLQRVSWQSAAYVLLFGAVTWLCYALFCLCAGISSQKKA